MPEQPDYTLHSSETHKLTVQILWGLCLTTKSKVKQYLYDTLVFAACKKWSINQTANNLQGLPTGATILNHLRAGTSNLQRLEKRINDILSSMLPKGFGKRGRFIAIDFIQNAFHGTVSEEHSKEVRRSKAKDGTTHFFTYATAYAVVRGRRYTLAMYRYTQEHNVHSILKKLVRRLLFLKIRIRLLLLDREFCNVEVLRYLQRAGHPFIMPMTKRGKTVNQEGGPTGTHALATLKESCWQRYEMKNSKGKRVVVTVAVVCINSKGVLNKTGRVTWLYAVGGVEEKPLTWIRETYRRRFGIEASYRQARQALIQTCSCQPGLRLLFLAIALILRNIWIWLHIEVIATPNQKERIRKPWLLRWNDYMEWLVIEVMELYPMVREITVSQDINAQKALFFNY